MATSFSPPKGIRCFSTINADSVSPDSTTLFQSPEGDSLFFYQDIDKGLIQLDQAKSFSPPKGIRCFSTNMNTFSKVFD